MSNRVLDELREMGKTDVLSFATTRHETRLQAERELLAAAYQWAVLHNPDALAPFSKRAADRARPAGAAGTPLITEYAAAAFGARIQTTPFGAKRLIADAVDIHHRLPRLQAGVTAGTVRVGHARHVATATRDLSDDEAAWVDNEVHEAADGRLGWARFEALVEGKVAAAAPATAAAKERAAALEHGTATLTVRGDAATIMSIEHAARQRANELEETLPGTTFGQRQIAALAGNVGAGKPRVKIYLHLAPGSPIARLEGHGPVTRDYVRHLVRDIAGQVRVQPVIDLNQTIAVDAYEIPHRLRQAVRLIHPGDVFPYAVNLSRAMDLDHQIPHAEGGETSTDNLGPLTRTHHRIKTHDNWEVRQPNP
ncbi:hypothetical protein ACFQ0K_04240 [Nocardioides caeni]|uniref:HNH endonuclease signature motif containing protein n=2 Tax=Nocardioides caeni TaxID=574700 RepID=UPI0031EC4047